MKVVVVGSGAREHALIKKFKSESEVSEVFAVGENAGIAADAEVLASDFTNIKETVISISKARPDLVVVGPEAPLVAGLVDSLANAGVRTFGPSAKAAELESSKAFAKSVMHSAGVATALASRCTDLDEAKQALLTRKPPYVVKDDALASGKGVVVTEDERQALAHAKEVLLGSGCVLVEDFLPGKEASLFFICDGESALPLIPARDHKRLLDGDLGPNTGGMGAYAPLPDFTSADASRLIEEVAHPILGEMNKRGVAFKGLLYAGLMLDGGSARIVEFNVRFGDPETQSVLPLMSSSLANLLVAAADGDLTSVNAPQWSDAAAVTVVLAADGYPSSPKAGAQISGLVEAATVPNVIVTHAGTTNVNAPRVNGGRVLSITATGESAERARDSAYRAVSKIKFEGMQYRGDIAKV
ncbi:MAG: phosphoribosylamine--glycine ligase [Actinobacteria bacterium]|nr:phosphoribosylamine--glycine ligase [Actinomycetota bacterium]